jgi:hypothetical protein
MIEIKCPYEGPQGSPDEYRAQMQGQMECAG